MILLIIVGIMAFLLGSCVIGCGLLVNSISEPEQEETKQEAKKDKQEAKKEENKIDGKITAVELSKEFMSNEVKANQKYKNKIYQISGNVEEINVTFGSMSVTLVGGELLNYVRLSISDKDENILASLEKGQEITVEGTIKGKLLLDVDIKDVIFVKY